MLASSEGGFEIIASPIPFSLSYKALVCLPTAWVCPISRFFDLVDNVDPHAIARCAHLYSKLSISRPKIRIGTLIKSGNISEIALGTSLPPDRRTFIFMCPI